MEETNDIQVAGDEILVDKKDALKENGADEAVKEEMAPKEQKLENPQSPDSTDVIAPVVEEKKSEEPEEELDDEDDEDDEDFGPGEEDEEDIDEDEEDIDEEEGDEEEAEDEEGHDIEVGEDAESNDGEPKGETVSVSAKRRRAGTESVNGKDTDEQEAESELPAMKHRRKS